MPVTDSRVKNGSLSLGGSLFSCQPTAVSIVPENEGGDEDTLEVLCGDVLTDATNATLTATLNITAVQDFTAASGQSLVAYSWANNNKEVAFEWSPTPDAQDKWVGKVVVQALEIGGEVATRLTTDAEWKITELTTPPRMGGDKVIGATDPLDLSSVVFGVSPRPADLAALKADVTFGDGNYTGAFTTGQYVVLGDGSKAHYAADAWSAGAAS